jgi:regulatory protein
MSKPRKPTTSPDRSADDPLFEAKSPEEQVADAKGQALKLLTRREHGREELLGKLVARGHSRAASESACDALAAAGLLSEARFVEHFVSVKTGRGAGPAKVRAELRAKGVAAAAIDAELANAGVDWLASCEQVRRKRFGEALPTTAAERARQARFLMGRGFGAEHIRRVLKGDVED